MRVHTTRTALLVTLLMALSACADAEEAPETAPEAEAPAATADGGMGGMEGMMGGMEGMGAMSAGMMEEMEVHMRAMEGAHGDSLLHAVPMHRRMTATLISRMNREMREMGMTADAEWTATVDSLRRDLTAMPEMTAAELEEAMPGHRARVERLMEMHRDMTSRMRR